MFRIMSSIYNTMKMLSRIVRTVSMESKSYWDRGKAAGHGARAKGGRTRNAVARRRRKNELAALSRKYNYGRRNFGRCW